MHAVSLLNVSGNRRHHRFFGPTEEAPGCAFSKRTFQRGDSRAQVDSDQFGPQAHALEPSEDQYRKFGSVRAAQRKGLFSVSRRNSYSCVWLVKITHAQNPPGAAEGRLRAS